LWCEEVAHRRRLVTALAAHVVSLRKGLEKVEASQEGEEPLRTMVSSEIKHVLSALRIEDRELLYGLTEGDVGIPLTRYPLGGNSIFVSSVCLRRIRGLIIRGA
jgi:hypothetical protein